MSGCPTFGDVKNDRWILFLGNHGNLHIAWVLEDVKKSSLIF